MNTKTLAALFTLAALLAPGTASAASDRLTHAEALSTSRSICTAVRSFDSTNAVIEGHDPYLEECEVTALLREPGRHRFTATIVLVWNDRAPDRDEVTQVYRIKKFPGGGLPVPRKLAESEA